VGHREIIVKQSAADSIAETAWFIESKGLVATGDKFADNVYDFFIKLSDPRRSHAICREPRRALMGYRCVPYKKKYTGVLIESDDELIICEFLSSKNIHW
jgi:hypothetical protein